jgi:hypothetical protein
MYKNVKNVKKYNIETVFWNVIPYGVVDKYRLSEELVTSIARLISTLIFEVAGFSETSLSVYHTAIRNIT